MNGFRRFWGMLSAPTFGVLLPPVGLTQRLRQKLCATVIPALSRPGIEATLGGFYRVRALLSIFAVQRAVYGFRAYFPLFNTVKL